MSGEPAPLPETPDERPWRRREYSGPASTLGLAGVIVLVVAAAVWYLEFRGGDGAGERPDGLGIVALPPERNTTGAEPAAREGRPAPDFVLSSFSGGTIRLSDLRGRSILLNFWASWCGPCRSESPDLEALAHRLGDAIVVLGVNQQEEPAAVRRFVGEFGITYSIALDRDGSVSTAYHAGRGLPISYLVDAAGVIRATFYGRLDDVDLARIEQAAGP